MGPLAATTDRFGQQGGAYLFNGSTSYVTVASSPSLSSPTQRITQCAWVLLNGTSLVGSAFDPILMKSSTTENAFMYRLYVVPDAIGVNYGDWVAGLVSTVAIGLGEWHHVASTYDGQKIRQYLDGAPVDSVAFNYTMVADTRPLLIGADTPGTFEVFNGKMDDVRIYDRALSAAEIATLGETTVGVGNAPATNALALGAPSPNPTRAGCTAQLTLPAASDVAVDVFDAAGRRVCTLVRGRMAAGTHTIVWDGRDARGEPSGAGLYFVGVRVGGEVRWGRVVRVR